MKKKQKYNEVYALMSLLKVFHENYISDEDYHKLDGLNPNDPMDVSKAVDLLLKPELATHSPESSKMLMDILQKSITNPKEDFSELFNDFGSVFDDEIINPRAFMTAILNALEANNN